MDWTLSGLFLVIQIFSTKHEVWTSTLKVQKVYKKRCKNWVYIKWILNDGALNSKKNSTKIPEVQFHGHYIWTGVSMLLTTVLLMYIYTACWLNNYVVQLCPFWCNSYGARLSRLLTIDHPMTRCHSGILAKNQLSLIRP